MTYNDIALLIIAGTFLVLAIFLARLLFVATLTLKKTNTSLDSLQNQLESLDQAPKEILQSAQNISSDLYHKMQCLNPLFHSLSNVGEGIETKTEPFRHKVHANQFKKKHEEEIEEEEVLSEEEDKLAPFVEFALAGMRLWQKVRKKYHH